MAACPGIYIPAEMKDGLLARVRVPGGELSADHLIQIAKIASTCGTGEIDLTNRANFQIRGITPDNWQNATNALIAAGLASDDPAHDRVRNIAIDPLTGFRPERFNCQPLARALDAALKDAPERACLSPKFAFVIDGAGPSNISALRHDIAWRAEEDGASAHIVFRLSLAGRPTSLTRPPEAIVVQTLAIIKALAPLANDAPILMKHLCPQGEATILHALANLPGQAGRAVTFLAPETASALTPSTGAITTTQKGRMAVTLSALTGRLHAHQMEGLAELVNRFASGALRLTPWQAVILPNVEENDIAKLWTSAEALGLLTQPGEQNLTILSCAGSAGCVHGGFETKTKALQLRDALAERTFLQPLTIHLSACEKGCAGKGKAALLLTQKRAAKDLQSSANPSQECTIEKSDDGGMKLYQNAAPSTQKAGQPVTEENWLEEMKKLL